MNSDSVLINSAGSIACGIFSIIMVFFFIGLPTHGIHNEIYPILKGPRPYKIKISNMGLSIPNLDYKISKRESLFLPIILKAADKHSVDPALVEAIIMAESCYDPKATSKKGAIGLMQIMPSTALALNIDDMYNPVCNIDAGVEYLKRLLTQFEGDLEMTIAAYNAGSSKVMEYRGVPPDETTRDYVKKVFEYYWHYRCAMI